MIRHSDVLHAVRRNSPSSRRDLRRSRSGWCVAGPTGRQPLWVCHSVAPKQPYNGEAAYRHSGQMIAHDNTGPTRSRHAPAKSRRCPHCGTQRVAASRLPIGGTRHRSAGPRRLL